jgi:hypothetical protein
MSDAPARLASLGRDQAADDQELTGVPGELAALMEKV